MSSHSEFIFSLQNVIKRPKLLKAAVIGLAVFVIVAATTLDTYQEAWETVQDLEGRYMEERMNKSKDMTEIDVPNTYHNSFHSNHPHLIGDNYCNQYNDSFHYINDDHYTDNFHVHYNNNHSDDNAMLIYTFTKRTHPGDISQPVIDAAEKNK
ncbi:hypothetical protein DPMN_062907 [Dreissena polymorpha]|uniref:Uncharacterized protein n=1 Tax=Dreissena polymorpha TaxID=45954 RepID=A0A9D4HIJ8_DREPO|nr:hypothetical protein DPMN_062907 [Dreissena polymorpha]